MSKIILKTNSLYFALDLFVCSLVLNISRSIMHAYMIHVYVITTDLCRIDTPTFFSPINTKVYVRGIKNFPTCTYPPNQGRERGNTQF
jgi:hypothetical protein